MNCRAMLLTNPDYRAYVMARCAFQGDREGFDRTALMGGHHSPGLLAKLWSLRELGLVR